MRDIDKTVLILDIEHRIACVREAGGSINDGSAEDGYYDIRSLRVMCDVAWDRARGLNCIEEEFTSRPKSASIHKDSIALLLRDERNTLLALTKEAEVAIESCNNREVKTGIKFRRSC
jgi:hypothetical protein